MPALFKVFAEPHSKWEIIEGKIGLFKAFYNDILYAVIDVFFLLMHVEADQDRGTL